MNDDVSRTVDVLRLLIRQFSTEGYCLALGGAHAKQVADKESDLDLYVFSRSIVPDSDRTRFALESSPLVRDVISWGAGPSFEQGGTDFYLGDLKIECWFRNTTVIERAITECIEGVIKRDFATWTITGFYNHCCLSDLNSMIPVDDPDGIIKDWKDRVKQYPPKLRAAIIERHLQAARFWPNNFHYRSAIERQDVIYTTGIVQQVVHNLIQVLFAVNQVYFPGDKKLDQAMRRLNQMPDHFPERIQKLLFPNTSISVDVLLKQQRELQQLLSAVEMIAQKI